MIRITDDDEVAVPLLVWAIVTALAAIPVFTLAIYGAGHLIGWW